MSGRSDRDRAKGPSNRGGDPLDWIEEAAAKGTELRGLIHEANATMRDLRQVRRELEDVRRQLPEVVSRTVQAELDKAIGSGLLDRLERTAREAAAQARRSSSEPDQRWVDEGATEATALVIKHLAKQRVCLVADAEEMLGQRLLDSVDDLQRRFRAES
jgi:hypothetical protein